MENLNAEHIKRGLECCTNGGRCLDCQYDKCNSLTKEGCMASHMRDALALINSQEQRIKELEAETKRLESLCVSKDIIIGDLSKENERLRADCAKGANALIEEMQKNRTIEADTVRKMQERFIAEIDQTPNANEHFIKAWKSKIDQIAREMLEGE